QIREAYRHGIIHVDLSEFNVMISGEECILIDWPQWVGTDHQNALDLLKRDIRNILTYFHRKYSLEYQLEETTGWVTG
ncbi:MAG: serine/threonine protein phosphatase, partial [Methanoregulaceae archaeon]|nr:serine/threonine protein phosphatase [Methanoregulaceae archaeon]